MVSSCFSRSMLLDESPSDGIWSALIRFEFDKALEMLRVEFVKGCVAVGVVY